MFSQARCIFHATARLSYSDNITYTHARRMTWRRPVRRHRPSTAWPRRPARAGGAAATRGRSGRSMRPLRAPLPGPRRRTHSGGTLGRGTPRTTEPLRTGAGPPASAPARMSCRMRRWRRQRRQTPSPPSATPPAWARSWAQVAACPAAMLYLSSLNACFCCRHACMVLSGHH